MDIETVPIEVVKEELPIFVEENFPRAERLRIIYAASKITDGEDPLLKAVLSYAEKIFGLIHFKMDSGDIGTAFFCLMPEGWKPPTPEQSEENIKTLDSLT